MYCTTKYSESNIVGLKFMVIGMPLRPFAEIIIFRFPKSLIKNDFKSLLYFTPCYSMCIRLLFSKKRKLKTNSQWNICFKLLLKVKKKQPFHRLFYQKKLHRRRSSNFLWEHNLRRQYQTPKGAGKYIHQYAPWTCTPIYTRKIYTNIHQENIHQHTPGKYTLIYIHQKNTLNTSRKPEKYLKFSSK